ncbi:hypothetical protein [Kocuria marina]|uniref:hypothetical protein n=1 Tax=Kocuria marina TaxID=223184 RepID=UPI0022E9263E|nr:hypothetical protein [Kocuria marina]
MNFNFTLDIPTKQIGFYCLVNDISYEERTLLALLDYKWAQEGGEPTKATWTLSPKYDRHFHYLPTPTKGVLRLRDFVFPEAVQNFRLSMVKHNPSAPDPSSIIQEVYALAIDATSDANTAIYKGLEDR